MLQLVEHRGRSWEELFQKDLKNLQIVPKFRQGNNHSKVWIILWVIIYNRCCVAYRCFEYSAAFDFDLSLCSSQKGSFPQKNRVYFQITVVHCLCLIRIHMSMSILSWSSSYYSYTSPILPQRRPDFHEAELLLCESIHFFWTKIEIQTTKLVLSSHLSMSAAPSHAP